MSHDLSARRRMTVSPTVTIGAPEATQLMHINGTR
jgi:hypothetical protein